MWHINNNNGKDNISASPEEITPAKFHKQIEYWLEFLFSELILHHIDIK